MPTLLRVGPYRLFMYMGDCRERHHVHVTGNGGVAKLWLRPVSIAEYLVYSPREMNRIKRIVDREQAALIRGFEAICAETST